MYLQSILDKSEYINKSDICPQKLAETSLVL